jgi:hypothetical protein
LGDRTDSVARCWLVDPPTGVIDNPQRFKVLTRLKYISELVSFIAERSTLAASLQTRLAALDALNDIMPLDRVPLRKGNGDEYSTATFDTTGRHNPWFSGKSIVIDGPAGGQVFVADRTKLLLLAIRERLIVLAATQNFSEIGEYQFPAAILEKSVQCVIPSGRFEQEFERIMSIPAEAHSRTGGYVRFVLSGRLSYSQSGFVFGVLPIPTAWQRRRR